MPTTNKASRDQVLTRVHTQLVRDAVKAAGKGGVLSKAEQAKMARDLLRDTAQQMRWAGKGTQVRLDAWVNKAADKVIAALDAVDKKGRGHGSISRAEAREAVATTGDAGFRIGRAFELITGRSLEAKHAAKPELVAAVQASVQAKLFDVLSGLKYDEPTAWVQDKIEKTLEQWGADGVNFSGKMKIGEEVVYVATGSSWGRDTLKETIGFFDTEGRVVGRAHIERDEDSFALTMKSMTIAGQAGATLAAAPAAGAPPVDQAWSKALEAELKVKYGNGDDLGREIKESELPAALLPQWKFMERNTPDGVGLEKISFQGKAAYAIHDYSCVSSVQIYTPEGTKLFGFV